MPVGGVRGRGGAPEYPVDVVVAEQAARVELCSHPLEGRPFRIARREHLGGRGVCLAPVRSAVELERDVLGKPQQLDVTGRPGDGQIDISGAPPVGRAERSVIRRAHPHQDGIRRVVASTAQRAAQRAHSGGDVLQWQRMLHSEELDRLREREGPVADVHVMSDFLALACYPADQPGHGGRPLPASEAARPQRVSDRVAR